MKRSRSIDISAMRKTAGLTVAAKPLALAIAAATFSGCSSNEPATVFKSVQECVEANAGTQEQCQQAHDDALAEAKRTGPKFTTRNDCEYNYGAGQCQQYNNNGQSVFIPLMAGYVLAQVIDEIGDSRRYRSAAPLYSSYGDWIGVDGRHYGSSYTRRIKVSKQTFEPKPAVTKTMSRGGFGSKVAAKSNWGGSKKSGGWSRGWGG